MRPEKASIVEDIRHQLSQSSFLLVIEFTGMRVDHFAELRKRLKGVHSRLQVVKNTFLLRAATAHHLPELGVALHGQNALVTGEGDLCAVAKVLKTFASEFEKPTFKTGVLDNSILSVEQIKALADLPPRDILRAQFLSLLNTPATRFVRTLAEPAASLARLLQAKHDQGHPLSQDPLPAA